jgi:predicted MFS family arabinose efflux permease
VILAVGVGVFVSRAYYIRIYRDLEKETLAVLLFGMIAMTVGILHVMSHNVWETFPQIVVSILGWGLLLKGASFIISPNWVDKVGDRWVNMQLVPYTGVAMLLLGAYLTWFAYLA